MTFTAVSAALCSIATPKQSLAIGALVLCARQRAPLKIADGETKSLYMVRLTSSCRRVLLKDMRKVKIPLRRYKSASKKHTTCEAQEKEKLGQRTSHNLHPDGGEQTHKCVKRDSSRTDQSTSRRPLTQTMPAAGNKNKQIRSTARDKAAPR